MGCARNRVRMEPVFTIKTYLSVFMGGTAVEGAPPHKPSDNLFYTVFFCFFNKPAIPKQLEYFLRGHIFIINFLRVLLVVIYPVDIALSISFPFLAIFCNSKPFQFWSPSFIINILCYLKSFRIATILSGDCLIYYLLYLNMFRS